MQSSFCTGKLDEYSKNSSSEYFLQLARRASQSSHAIQIPSVLASVPTGNVQAIQAGIIVSVQLGQ